MDRLEGREMPGSFLGEMAALWWGERLGSFDPGASSAVAPTISPPAHPVSDPPPNDPPAAPPFAVSFPSPTPPPDTPTPGGILSGTYDLTPINLGFGSHVAYNPPAVTLDLPHPTVAPTATPSDSTPPQSKTPFVTPDGVDAPKSDPITPGKSAKGGVSSFADSNQPPVANDDSYTVIHDQQLDVDATNGLLSNDYDYENDPLGIVVVSLPSNGTIDFQSGSVSGDGSFQYLPDNGYVGTDTFTYKVYDATGESSVATVSIIVTNTAPVAAADSFTINEDQVLNAGDLLANDTDADGDPLGTTLVSSPTNGELQLNEDGTFTYTPNVNFVGTDSFTYSTTDGLVGTSPQTVSITVQSAGPFDLDGRDDSTLTTWMSEPDEAAYGLGVSVGNPATITPRVHDLPPGWVFSERRITFDPEVLSVGGNTTGTLTLSNGGGNESIPVVALVTGYGSTQLWYESTCYDTTAGGGGLGGALTSRIRMDGVEKKAILRNIKFTSDHEVIRENGPTVLNGGKFYKDISDKQFIRATGYSAPMTQTRSTATTPSKVTVEVTWDRAGIPVDTEYRLVGHAKNGETALEFTSDVYTATAQTAVLTAITATNDVGGGLRVIDDEITWALELNPGPLATSLPMGKSGSHKIYVTYDKPGDGGGEMATALKVTPARMQRAIDAVGPAFENAKLQSGVAEPKPQRIVFETVRRHEFNLYNHFVTWAGSVTGPYVRNYPNAWKVYDSWSDPNPDEKGADCVSGAAFTLIATRMIGIYASDVKAYTCESETNLTNAVLYNKPDAGRSRTVGMGKEYLILLDKHDRVNLFEATVVFTNLGQTFYFPVGTEEPRSLNSKDKVIRTMIRPAWANEEGVVQELALYTPLTDSDFYSVD